MISKVSFRNFKCLRDVQIDLERFTVLVGPNASGKSSILQGLELLCRSFANQASGLEVDLSEAISRGKNACVEVAVAVSPDLGGRGYRYRTRPSAGPGIVQLSGGTRPGQSWSGEGWGVAPDLNSPDWVSWAFKPGQQAPLPLSALLRPEASKLMSSIPASPDPTVMLPDGTGLHSALANMALNDPDAWQQLQTNLRRIIPTIRRLRHTKATLQAPAALLFDTVGADSLPAWQVSEGTLLVLGLLTILHTAGRPSLVLLDDLDRGLHPRAQRELIELLRGLLDTNPDLQLIATTHSPYMLDCMEGNEVRMTQLNDDGSSVCAALTRHPKFEKWKDEFHSGEMWSMFGEKWLVDQDTAAK